MTESLEDRERQPQEADQLELRQPASPPNPTTPSQSLEDSSESTVLSEEQAFSANHRGASPDNIGTYSISPDGHLSRMMRTLEEVSAYFQQRWQGSDGDEPLIYQLQLTPEGTIATINPLNVPARRQPLTILDRTMLDTPIVQPFESDQPLILRLVLGPDGQVQVSEIPR